MMRAEPALKSAICVLLLGSWSAFGQGASPSSTPAPQLVVIPDVPANVVPPAGASPSPSATTPAVLTKDFTWELLTKRPTISAGLPKEITPPKAVSLAKPLNVGHGPVIAWQRSDDGTPYVELQSEIVLTRAIVPPGATGGAATATTTVTEHLIFEQAVVFSTTESGAWIAVSSPITVRATSEAGEAPVLPIEQNRGTWEVLVGPAGLILENFFALGVAAAREPLEKRYSPAEMAAIVANHEASFLMRVAEK